MTSEQTQDLHDALAAARSDLARAKGLLWRAALSDASVTEALELVKRADSNIEMAIGLERAGR